MNIRPIIDAIYDGELTAHDIHCEYTNEHGYLDDNNLRKLEAVAEEFQKAVTMAREVRSWQ
jgi:hypothetical protein